MFKELKAPVTAIVVSVIAALFTATIIFYAGQLYSSSTPISAEVNIVTVPNPIATRFPMLSDGHDSKALTEVMSSIPTEIQGMLRTYNIFRVLTLDLKNDGDTRSDQLELLSPTNTVIGYYVDPNHVKISTDKTAMLGSLNPGEVLHAVAIGPLLFSEKEFSLLSNGKKISIDGPFDPTRWGVVPYAAMKYPSLVSLLLLVGFVCFAVLIVSAGVEAYFTRHVAAHAKRVSVEELRKHKRLLEYVQANDPEKYAAAGKD